MVYTIGGEQFTRRKKITLIGGSSGAQTDYQLMLTVDHEPGMNSDFSDVRFASDTEQLSAWLESKTDGVSADIWVKFPHTPADGDIEDYWMYYGNAEVASDWDGAKTFELFDDFNRANSGMVGNGWSETGDAQIKNNNCYAAGTSSSIEKPFDFSAGLFGITARVKKTAFSRTFQINLYDGSYRSILSMSQSNNPPSNDAIGRYNGPYILDPYNEGQYYILQHNRVGSNLYDMWVGDSSITNQTGSYATSAKKISILLCYDSDSDGFVDWVFIRKYAVNPPTAVFGTEEHQRRTPQFM